MSSEKEQGKKPSSEEQPTHSIPTDKNPKGAQTATSSTTASSSVPQSQQSSSPPDKKPAPVDDSTTYPSTPERPRPRQVIAVSASKGPAAFFNLARKFLVTDEMCDLSALEGAIVSAADAAHLLERSKLATIVRYVVPILVVLSLRVSHFLSCCMMFVASRLRTLWWNQSKGAETNLSSRRRVLTLPLVGAGRLPGEMSDELG